MRRKPIFAGIISLGLAANPALAGEVLQPPGLWRIDSGPRECGLLRTFEAFGAGDQRAFCARCKARQLR